MDDALQIGVRRRRVAGLIELPGEQFGHRDATRSGSLPIVNVSCASSATAPSRVATALILARWRLTLTTPRHATRRSATFRGYERGRPIRSTAWQ